MALLFWPCGLNFSNSEDAAVVVVIVVDVGVVADDVVNGAAVVKDAVLEDTVFEAKMLPSMSPDPASSSSPESAVGSTTVSTARLLTPRTA